MRDPNSPRGTSGDAVRCSTSTNATPADAATTHAATTTARPVSVDPVSAYVAAARATTVSVAPSMSKRPVAPGSRLSGAAPRVSTTTATHSGTLMAKIQRQLLLSTIHPPTTGPIAAATPDSPAQVPMAGAR